MPLTPRRTLAALASGLAVASSTALFAPPAAAAVPGTFTASIADCTYNEQSEPAGARIQAGVTGGPANTKIVVRFTVPYGDTTMSLVGTTDGTGSVSAVSFSAGGKTPDGRDNYPMVIVGYADTNGDEQWSADEQIGDPVTLPLAGCPNPPPPPVDPPPPPGEIPPGVTSMGTFSPRVSECYAVEPGGPLVGAIVRASVTGGPTNTPIVYVGRTAAGLSLGLGSLGTTDGTGALTDAWAMSGGFKDSSGGDNFPMELVAFVDRNADGLNGPEDVQIGSAMTVPLECPPPPAAEADETFGDGGGTASTGDGTALSSTNPIDATVTTTVAGRVQIVEGPVGQAAPEGFTFLGRQVDITAPLQSADNPLRLAFTVDASVIPEGQTADSVLLFRDGQPIVGCTSQTQAQPDPCIVSRETLPGGALRITALSSHASAWNVGVSIAANLSVAATAPATSLVGSDLTTTVTVRNDGPVTATKPRVAVTLPAGAVPATLPTGCTGTGPITCRLPNLAKGGTATLTLTATPVKPGAAQFAATVSSGAPDPLAGDNTAATSTSVTGVACTKVGTQGDDRLTGTTGTDVICGLGGNDTVLAGRGDDVVVGGSGNDTLSGEAGRDVVTGGTGKDVVRGGDGDDLLDVRDGAAGDSADGQAGRNLCTRDGGDTVTRCT
ncbi:hypothetical protein [Geodermatophilus sp. URMC 64]